MSDFLLELLSEEIPARMQEKASADLARLFAAEIARAGLKAEAIESFVTPRRLALIARRLPAATEAVSEEMKGPRADAPEQAIAGFLGKAGLTRDQLVERADAKGNTILFAITSKPGRRTADVLAEAIPAIVRAFPWPKAMRWGAASLSPESPRWVRPLQGIVALLGEDVVPFEIAGIASWRETVGHRFHHHGPVVIAHPGAYVETMRRAHVIVDHLERRLIVREEAEEAAAVAGLRLVEDEGLVHENAGLTEWPVPLLGRFDPAFLAVPREVIQLTMRTNQKYFACTDGEGHLAPAFVCTANIVAADGGAKIVEGNGKVLAARLSDARFFWEQDLKVPLAVRAERLKDIVFHEKLGTVADKVARVATLAEWLAREGIVPGADPALARQAAELCKADLVTGMVGEFPELQGVMGGYYARAEGLPEAVADAIRDHYKPVGQGDEVPVAPVTVAVALADKLDSVVQFFYIGEAPTGSKDPFALRRSALGIIALIIRNNLRLNLSDVLPRGDGEKRDIFEDGDKITGQIFDFFADRLKIQQREAGVRHDLIDAVFALGGEDDLVRLLARVKALQKFVETEDGANLVAGYRRAANILRAEEKKDGAPSPPFEGFDYDPDPAEAALAGALARQIPLAQDAIVREDFESAMQALSVMRPAIDRFFDDVTVNSPDGTKRSTRLSLLATLYVAMQKIADFSRLEG
ncbi:MAG TPA: glycine--tRNA ligase subunit beta [Sphingomonas sp.]